MYLENIHITNFRNYDSCKISCSPKVNCLTGLNGMGKTSILEAIYYLCMGKSHSNALDVQIVKEGLDFFRIDSNWKKKEQLFHVVYKVPIKKKKVLEINGTPVSRLADHIGNFPVVMITPEETLLATEGSEVRRKYMDATLSQVNQLYLKNLLAYNKILDQRNALLKQPGNSDLNALLEIYDLQLVKYGSVIHQERQQFILEITTLFFPIYEAISGKKEIAQLKYVSKLIDTEFDTLLKNARSKDILLQRTNVGIHKDDLDFEINGRPLKKFASQGQLKSFVLALKIAQFEYLMIQKGVAPILLLDDIFDRLDQTRISFLLQKIETFPSTQIFITDTDSSRTQQILQSHHIEFKHFVIDNGMIV